MTIWRKRIACWIPKATNTQSKYVIKVKLFRYRPSVAQSVGGGISLLFHDRGTRRG